jgi:catechol 2,3-dioxygenase-like lactoylglutathione lyase family enzyme
VKIKLASVFVDDQDKALRLYTEVLGFAKKRDIPVGEFRWLTVVSPEEPDGAELLLEPNDNPAAKTYQKSLFDQGIPATTFFVADIQEEYERIKKLGVVFTLKPTKTGPTIIAVFDDTCGNLIQIARPEWHGVRRVNMPLVYARRGLHYLDRTCRRKLS